MKSVQRDLTLDLSDVSIVVLSFNRKDTLARNLAALTQMVEEAGCELIVVDNASTDGSAEIIPAMLAGRPNTRFIANEDNLGVAGGRNAGWREASREFILNVDDDALVAIDAIVSMLSLMRAQPGIAIISPRILHAETRTRQLDMGDCQRSIANFHGACHLLRTALIERIGINDELCSFGGEEIDYSIRARSAGFDVVYTPDATVLHNTLARVGVDGSSRRQRWIYNFTRVFFKHFPLGFATVLSGRYLLSHVVSGVRAYGPLLAGPLLVSAFRGFRDGRRQHKPAPARVVQFYRDPSLRPEFGNVPVWRKLWQMVAAK